MPFAGRLARVLLPPGHVKARLEAESHAQITMLMDRLLCLFIGTKHECED